MKTETNWYICLLGKPGEIGIEVMPFDEVPKCAIPFELKGYKTKKRALVALIRNLNHWVENGKVELGKILLEEQEHLLNDPETNFYKQMLIEQDRERHEREQKWLEERAKK
jgi:hypothetical protein